MKHKPTRFSGSLATVIADEEWQRLPDNHILKVYEEQIRRLEAQIDELIGVNKPQRIDALDQKVTAREIGQ